MTGLHFTVHGVPAPQGSKRHVGNGVMVESSKAVKPWREAVKWAALRALEFDTGSGLYPIDAPVRLTLEFRLPAPKSASRAKLALGPCRKPDIDKLLRSTLDAITDAGLIVDDARVVEVVMRKVYGQPGCVVSVEAVA